MTEGPVREITDSKRWIRARRWFERPIALALLALTSPLLALIALAVRLESRGQVLFRQTRLGREGKEFTVLKFRTMRQDAPSELHRQYVAKLARGEEGDDGPKKLRDDPRITRVGAVLRATSLDELPQLVNVLQGEMSLVGPRPALAYELEHYDRTHFDRFLVPPGLTGLWQVAGRYRLGFREMLDLDVRYAHAASPALDARILMRTPLALVQHRGA